MKLTTPMLTLGGQPIGETDRETGSFAPFLLRDVLTQSLLGNLDSDVELSAADKVRLFKLATSIHGEDEIDLRAEDISLLKARVGALFTALIVGQVFPLLDPAE